MGSPVHRARRCRPGLWAAAGVIVALLHARAQSASEPPLTHRNWWNFYERGVGRLARDNAAGAREDFETALGLRRGARFGYGEDQWRVRTYGMHFLEGYFPNRELGVALFTLGQDQEALRFLEKSMSQTPSGRAKHYLNRVRERLLAGQPVAPPEIVADATARERWTNLRKRAVTGTARAPGRVRAVEINGRPQFIELAQSDWAFRDTLPLSRGVNRITITARDLAGQETRQDWTWLADWDSPRLEIHRVEAHADGWRVEAVCGDDQALRVVRVGDRVVLDSAGREETRRVPFQFLVPMNSDVLVTGEDYAGNRLRQAVSPASLVNALRDSAHRQYAQLGGGVPDAPPADDGAETADRLKPSLQLSGIEETTVVFDEEFFLDGQAQDGGGLASLSINGEELLEASSRGAIQSYFSRRLPLDAGTNAFEVVARDRAGNVNRKAFRVVRASPEYLDAEFRLTIGVPPLTAAEDVALAQTAKRDLEQEITREPVRFHLLERDEGWDFILREQNLSLSDLSDPRAALRIGKMLPAELLLMGGLASHGRGLTIFIKVVESGNGQVLFIEDVYGDPATPAFSQQLAGLAKKIKQRFPLVEGAVVETRGERVTLNVGQQDGVRAGLEFVVVEKGAAGAVRRADARPVILVAERVKADSSIARFKAGAAAAPVAAGDGVYAR
jgi:hypothetical protein